MRAALLLALVAAGCAAAPTASPPSAAIDQVGMTKRNELMALWTQIRDWRREADMGVEPAPDLVLTMDHVSAPAAARTCPDSHVPPKACGDVCELADAICDNAESICDIAHELGDGDAWAKDKCDSAKASCREAKTRCCGCSEAALGAP